MDEIISVRIIVQGLVQGIGFRPFVAGCAEQLHIAGTVRNAGGIVTVYAKAPSSVIEVFLGKVRNHPPFGAVITDLTSEPVSEADFQAEIALAQSESQAADHGSGSLPEADAFYIVKSAPHSDHLRLLPPDLPICPNCEKELLDPNNRRYRYPFISCVSCGPRFSIMHSVPYDRDTTTMDAFTMCPDCHAEYTRKMDIRRHAQTISCHKCGPQLWLEDGQNTVLDGDSALSDAIIRLHAGQIGAVLDIGGFHFAFDPFQGESARRLRVWKNREAKPFAVMFPDISSVRKYCTVSPAEEKLLLSNARPIVLCAAKKVEPGAAFAPEILAGSSRIGAMLPCSPLQILLLQETGPLVMTSGNRGGEPIVTDPGAMRSLLGTDGPDFMLAHGRKILTPLDDSIYQVVQENEIQILRRARGIVPEPVALPFSLKEDTFAAGGDLKAVFALGRENKAYLSGHFGDLIEIEAENARKKAIAHMEDLLAIEPSRAVCDLHPSYVSVKETMEAFSRPKLSKDTSQAQKFCAEPCRVQHHLSHVASAIAENGLYGAVCGIAYDGTGYGLDGSVWGSEFFFCSIQKGDPVRFCYRHAGSLLPVAVLGGDSGAKDALKTLYCFLKEAEKRGLLTEETAKKVLDRTMQKTDTELTAGGRKLIDSALDNHINVITSSSMGRFFDAVSALLAVCCYNSYEGECPTKLETFAEEAAKPYPLHFVLVDSRAEQGSTGEALLFIDSVSMIADLAAALLRGEDPKELALGFHIALAEATSQVAEQIFEQEGITGQKQVVLSGGTYLNRILNINTIKYMEKVNITSFQNHLVPPGDGGISLGQLYLSGCELQDRSEKR